MTDPDPQWHYQRYGRYFAVTGAGVETLAAAELREWGATRVEPGYRGVHVCTDRPGLYRILYGSRVVSRVLAPLETFDCHSDNYLYRRIHALPWDRLFTPRHTFAVRAVTANSALQHSRYAALVVKDAVADAFRDSCGSRPSVDTSRPDITLHLHIHHNRATLSVDLAGESLHRRGYRQVSVEAPMQETLAAALVRAAGYRSGERWVDPFCGSGTLLCEAWMVAARIPAGYLRARYALEMLPDFNRSLWQQEKARIDGHITVPDVPPIEGADIDPAAVEAARANLSMLPGGDRVPVVCRDVRHQPGWKDTVIVTNPPYGVRLASAPEVTALYKDLGDLLKKKCVGCRALIFSGKPEYLKALGLKPAWTRTMFNGGLEGQCAAYMLFAGLARQTPRDQRRWPSPDTS